MFLEGILKISKKVSNRNQNLLLSALNISKAYSVEYKVPALLLTNSTNLSMVQMLKLTHIIWQCLVIRISVKLFENA